eukprot:5800263-Amphidinium_carterae.1
MASEASVCTVSASERAPGVSQAWPAKQVSALRLQAKRTPSVSQAWQAKQVSASERAPSVNLNLLWQAKQVSVTACKRKAAPSMSPVHRRCIAPSLDCRGSHQAKSRTPTV